MIENQNQPPNSGQKTYTKLEEDVISLLRSNKLTIDNIKETLIKYLEIKESVNQLREQFTPVTALLKELRVGQQEIVDTQQGIHRQIADAFSNLQISMNTTIGEARKDFDEQQGKLRGALLGKMDALQNTMDLLRERVQNSWNTADFAITSGRSLRNDTNNLRDETDKLLTMISTMQKQQNILESQVELLRRGAAEKE